MKPVSSIQVTCTTVISAALHMSLLVFSTDDSSSVTSTPVEDLFHVELTAVENDQDPTDDFYEPKRTNPLRDTSPDTVDHAQTLSAPPTIPKTLLTQEPLKQPLIKGIVQDIKTNDPKIAPTLENLKPIQVTELNSEEGIKQVEPADEPPPKPTHPVLPTHDVPLQISEIDPGNAQEIVIPKTHVLEPTLTHPIQSEPQLAVPPKALDTQSVSKHQKVTGPVRPVENFDLVKPLRSNEPIQPSEPSTVTARATNLSPVVVQKTELALKPLKPAPQIVEHSKQNLARSTPVTEHISDDGGQKKEEKQAIAQYVTLLHKVISIRARRDYPSRALKRREEGRVLAEIKVDPDGELLEIKISNESTASDTLIRAAERAIKKEAPFAQFAQVVNKKARWFSLSLNYRIHTASE